MKDNINELENACIFFYVTLIGTMAIIMAKLVNQLIPYITVGISVGDFA